MQLLHAEIYHLRQKSRKNVTSRKAEQLPPNKLATMRIIGYCRMSELCRYGLFWQSSTDPIAFNFLHAIYEFTLLFSDRPTTVGGLMFCTVCFFMTKHSSSPRSSRPQSASPLSHLVSKRGNVNCINRSTADDPSIMSCPRGVVRGYKRSRKIF